MYIYEHCKEYTNTHSIHIYIYIYIFLPWLRNLNTDFTLKSCLFESVELTKIFDPDKYKHSRYIIVFDSRSEFILTDGSKEKMSKFLRLT